MSENTVRCCLWLMETHETINQVVLNILICVCVGEDSAERHMDLPQLRRMLVSTDILRQNMILFLIDGGQTSAMKHTGDSPVMC